MSQQSQLTSIQSDEYSRKVRNVGLLPRIMYKVKLIAAGLLQYLVILQSTDLHSQEYAALSLALSSCCAKDYRQDGFKPGQSLFPPHRSAG